MNRWLHVPAGVALAAAQLLGSACEEKKSTSETPAPDASARVDKYATADPKLAKALQAATSASPDGDNGPPQDGVFGPGLADRRHPIGTPTKVDVATDGSEPRVLLAPATDATPETLPSSSYGPALLEIAMQLGPRTVMPTVDMKLSLGPAKKDDGGAEWLVADVKRALTAKEQPGQLPPGMEKDIASLEGTQLRLRLTADGRESEHRTQLGKATNPQLERLADAAAEAVALATVPLPTKPVGVGAQWIAESRMPWLGIDAIVYRAYRLKSISGDRLRLVVDVTAYASGAETKATGAPPGSTMAQFGGGGHGEMELVRGEVVARKSDLQGHAVVAFEAPGTSPTQGQAGQPPQPNMLTGQFQSTATFVRGDDLRSAARE